MLDIAKNLIREKLTTFTMSADSYQRYKFVSGLLKKEKCKTVLDVGGGSGKFFRRFLPDRKSLTADIEDGDVIGDGRDLPFGKKSFDGVTALETLQYVKKEDRKKFVQELVRVARKCVIITLPLDESAVRTAESACNSFYSSLFGNGNRWLDEHTKSGLPSEKEIKDLLGGFEFEMYRICYLGRWKKMLKINFVLQKIHANFLSSIINTIYIALYGFDIKEPSYTKVFFISLQKGLR